jgi:hypothetical protein
MPVDPSSSEEQRMVAEYHVATERYTAAVGELSVQRATLTKEDYQKLLNLVEDAGNECERCATRWHGSIAINEAHRPLLRVDRRG